MFICKWWTSLWGKDTETDQAQGLHIWRQEELTLLSVLSHTLAVGINLQPRCRTTLYITVWTNQYVPTWEWAHLKQWILKKRPLLIEGRWWKQNIFHCFLKSYLILKDSETWDHIEVAWCLWLYCWARSESKDILCFFFPIRSLLRRDGFLESAENKPEVRI